MKKPAIPAYKKDQQDSRQAVRALTKPLHVSGTLELGIKAFKRGNPDKRHLFADYKRNAWASYDPKKITARYKPTPALPPVTENYQLPEGLTNRQRHHLRRGIRQQIKEAEHAQRTAA